MILSEFAKFLHKNDENLLTGKTSSVELLAQWIKSVIGKNPKNHSQKIIHKEIMYAQNENNDYIIVGKSDSGRVLISALIKFAKSYDNYIQSKWREITEKTFHKE